MTEETQDQMTAADVERTQRLALAGITRAAKRYRDLKAKAEEARLSLNDEIRAAHADGGGVPLRAIATASGLSHERIHQITS
jgi:hypothetical protein